MAVFPMCLSLQAFPVSTKLPQYSPWPLVFIASNNSLKLTGKMCTCSHQAVIETLWFHFWGVFMSSACMCSLSSKLGFQLSATQNLPLIHTGSTKSTVHACVQFKCPFVFIQGAGGRSAPAQHKGVPHFRRIPLHRWTCGHSAQHSSAARLCKQAQVLLQRYIWLFSLLTGVDQCIILTSVGNKSVLALWMKWRGLMISKTDFSLSSQVSLVILFLDVNLYLCILCVDRRVCWFRWESAHSWERRKGEGHQPAEGRVRLQDCGDDRRWSHWSWGLPSCCKCCSSVHM